MSALASQGRQPEQAQDSTGHRNYWQVTFIDQPPHSHTTGGNSAARKQYLWIFSISFELHWFWLKLGKVCLIIAIG